MALKHLKEVMIIDYKHLEKTIQKHGFQDFKWLDAKDIVVKHWVRFKCLLTCDTFGTKAVCPPNMPSVDECKEFFSEYSTAVVLRIAKQAHHRDQDTEVFQEIDNRMIELEKEIFYSGYYKVMAFSAAICCQCEECSGDINTCADKQGSRPTAEALGVDLFQTVKQIGYPAEVLANYEQQMNRYYLIMIE